MRTLTCSPETEVLGKNVLAILENVQADEIRPYAEKYGLTEINADQWYSAQSWLDLMNDLGRKHEFYAKLGSYWYVRR